jgi:long-chain acyl-CoA synthetase
VSKAEEQINSTAPVFWTKNYPKVVPHSIDQEIEKYSSTLDIFKEAVQRFPNHIAFSNMGKTLTYTELNKLSESFAAFLQNELKLQKGDRIALQMPNLLQFPIAMYGALKAGLVIVNTNPLYTEREMRYQFADSGATAIVILANFANHLEKIISETQLQHVIVTELGDMFDFPKRTLINFALRYVKKMVPRHDLKKVICFRTALCRGRKLNLSPVKTNLDEIAFLQYTGGTTGVSKAAMLSHRNIVANMSQIHAWMRPLLREGQEVAICALPLYHIFALTLNGLAFGKLGAHNVLITNPRDIPGFIKELKRQSWSVMSGVNTLFNALLAHPDFATLDFKPVKISVAGGMPLQKSVAERWKISTKTVLIEGYGLTEASPVVCCNPIDGTDQVGTIGLPLPSTLIKIIDDEGSEVPTGSAGELCVKGPQVMHSYWLKPEETKIVFSEDGWLRTGDIVIQNPDGFCKIVDRKKDMILVSGFNVYPNEVEEVISSHPGVLEVAAIGYPDERAGEVVKVVIVKRDPSLTEIDVLNHARQGLTSYKVPKYVEFRLDLPKTNVGKILRRLLKDN